MSDILRWQRPRSRHMQRWQVTHIYIQHSVIPAHPRLHQWRRRGLQMWVGLQRRKRALWDQRGHHRYEFSPHKDRKRFFWKTSSKLKFTSYMSTSPISDTFCLPFLTFNLLTQVVLCFTYQDLEISTTEPVPSTTKCKIMSFTFCCSDLSRHNVPDPRHNVSYSPVENVHLSIRDSENNLIYHFCLHWLSSSQNISLVWPTGQQDGGSVQSWKRTTCCQHPLEPRGKHIGCENIVWTRWIFYSRESSEDIRRNGHRKPELCHQSPVLERGEDFGTKTPKRSDFQIAQHMRNVLNSVFSAEVKICNILKMEKKYF